MPGRDIHATMETGLEGQVIRPVLVGRFDIVSDPLTAWTGPGAFMPTGTGDTALDGQTFATAAPFMALSDVVEDQGIGGSTTITISGEDLNEDILRQVVRDRSQWRGQKAYLWIGLLDTDEYTVLANPIRIKTGVMTQMTVERKANDATVTVTIDRDLGRAHSAPFRWIDHQRLWTADTWSTYIQDLANNPEGFTNSPIRGNGFNGGGNIPDPKAFTRIGG